MALSWTAPSNGGSAITKYQYSASTGADNWQDIPGSGAATTSYTVTGLTNGQSYTFKVRAVNSVGEGAEATATATPAAAADNTVPIPGGGGAITVSGVGQNALTLAWIKATDNTSAQTALKYYVYRSAGNNISTVSDCENNGTLLNVGSTADIGSYNATGLTANTTYYFNIIVVDEVGNKAIYTGASGTTTAAPATFTVSVAANPAAGGSVTGGGTFNEGTNQTVTATANMDYQFVNWTENGVEVSTSASYSFTLTANRTLVANFNYTGGGNPPVYVDGSISPSSDSFDLYM